jgi:hypothetical protein
MESQRFDRITTTFARSNSRRGVMTLLGAAALGAGGLAFFAADEGEARRKKKKKKGKGKGKGNQRCLKSGQRCDTDKQCCGNNLICDVPQNASNSDTECCGGQGAVCGGVNDNGDFLEPYCCIGEAGVRSFVCSQNDPGNPNVRGTCIPAPPDEV